MTTYPQAVIDAGVRILVEFPVRDDYQEYGPEAEAADEKREQVFAIAIYEAMSAAMWQPTEMAKVGKVYLVYGVAGHRFAKQDENGQWRNMMGRPINHAPAYIRPLPAPPE